MLKLQHASEKERSNRSFAPIEWSESLQSWVVFDPALMGAIMASADFVVVDYAGEYAKLEQRTRMDWSGVLDALYYVPLAQEEQRHFQLRREYAQLIAARSASAKKAMKALVARLVPVVFRNGQNPELIQDLIRPMTDALFGELLGAAVPKVASEGPSPSQIFDRFLGLNRRKKMQDRVALLKEAFATQTLATSPEHGTALLIVGYDSLAGSLGSSLVAILRRGEGLRLCDMDRPDVLPSTGVPYVERVAARDCRIRGIDVRAGERIRLFLDACPATRKDSQHASFFGRGRHICLGQDLSQCSWRILVRELAKIPLKVRIVEATLRQHDYVFSAYDSVRVSVYE